MDKVRGEAQNAAAGGIFPQIAQSLSIGSPTQDSLYILRLDYFDFLQICVIGDFMRFRSRPIVEEWSKYALPFGPIQLCTG